MFVCCKTERTVCVTKRTICPGDNGACVEAICVGGVAPKFLEDPRDVVGVTDRERVDAARRISGCEFDVGKNTAGIGASVCE